MGQNPFIKENNFKQPENYEDEDLQMMNQSSEAKMAAFETFNSAKFMMEVSSTKYSSYPNLYSHNESRRNLQISDIEMHQNTNNLLNYQFQDHKNQDPLEKVCSFDINKQNLFGTPQDINSRHGSNLHNLDHLESNQIHMDDLEGLEMLRDFNSRKQPLPREMAPQMDHQNPLKGFTSPNFNKYHALTSNPLYPYNSAPHVEQTTRVNFDYSQQRSDQYQTPIKNIEGGNSLYQRNIYTDLKTSKSSKKADLENLANISREFLPVHFIKDKSSKQKMISYSSSKLSKVQNSGKGKSSISKTTQASSEKKVSYSNAGFDFNRRVNKAKHKKRANNKTEPSITEDDFNIETFRSALSVQVYEIQCLNSLEDFNKKLKEQRKSFSLMGNKQDDFNSLKATNQQEKRCYASFKEIQEKSNQMFGYDASFHEPLKLIQQSLEQNHPSQNHQQIEGNQVLGFQKDLSMTQPNFQPQSQNLQLFTIQDLRFPLLPQNNASNNSSDFERKIRCNCTKNFCKQGYCECLKNNLACDANLCKCCEGCENTEHNHLLRSEIIQKQTKTGKKEGCNCKNSKCQKKYCECFQLGKICDPTICKCKGCKNNDVAFWKQQKVFAQLYSQ